MFRMRKSQKRGRQTFAHILTLIDGAAENFRDFKSLSFEAVFVADFGEFSDRKLQVVFRMRS